MKQLLFTFLFFAFIGCNTFERNCTDFKTGNFYSEITIDGKIYKSNFSRTEDTQMEVFEGDTSFAEVRWINNCELVFKTKNPKNMAERKDIHLKILTTTDSSYTFEYAYVGETNKQKGTAFRIN